MPGKRRTWESRTSGAQISTRIKCGGEPFLILCDHPDMSVSKNIPPLASSQALDFAIFSIFLAKALEGTAIVRGEFSAWDQAQVTRHQNFDENVASLVRLQHYVLLISSASSSATIKVEPINQSLFAEIVLRKLEACDAEGRSWKEFQSDHPLITHAKKLDKPYVHLKIPDAALTANNVALISQAIERGAEDYERLSARLKYLKNAKYAAAYYFSSIVRFSKTLQGVIVLLGSLAVAIVAIFALISQIRPPRPIYNTKLAGNYSIPLNGNAFRADLMLDQQLTIGLYSHYPNKAKALPADNDRCSLNVIPDSKLIRQFTIRSTVHLCSFHISDEPAFFTKSSSPQKFLMAISVTPPHVKRPIITAFRMVVLHDFGVPVIYMPSVVALESNVRAKVLFNGKRPATLGCNWMPGVLFQNTSCDTYFKSPANLDFYPESKTTVSVKVTIQDSKSKALILLKPQPVVVSFLKSIVSDARAQARRAPVAQPYRKPPLAAHQPFHTIFAERSDGDLRNQITAQTAFSSSLAPASHRSSPLHAPKPQPVIRESVRTIIHDLKGSEDVTRYDRLSAAIKTVSSSDSITVKAARELLGSIREPARNDAIINLLLPHIATPLASQEAVQLLRGTSGYDRAVLLEALAPCVKQPIARDARLQLLETIRGFSRISAEDMLGKSGPCSAGLHKAS